MARMVLVAGLAIGFGVGLTSIADLSSTLTTVSQSAVFQSQVASR